MKTFALSLIALLPLLANAVGAKPTLALSAPQDYQVFQRQTRTQGTVSIEGRADDGTAVEVRVAGATGAEWQSLPVDPKTGTASPISPRSKREM